jgi:hypothetical protein
VHTLLGGNVMHQTIDGIHYPTSNAIGDRRHGTSATWTRYWLAAAMVDRHRAAGQEMTTI